MNRRDTVGMSGDIVGISELYVLTIPMHPDFKNIGVVGMSRSQIQECVTGALAIRHKITAHFLKNLHHNPIKTRTSLCGCVI